MNNNEAIKLLDDTFKFEFNSLKFSNFLNELFNGFYPQPKSMGIYKEYEQQIVSMNKLGNYKHGKKSMEIMVVRLKKGTSLDKARTMQRNVIAKWLKNGNINSALVAFTSEDSHDWRLSFVKMDYNFGEGNKVLEELTPAKRYSFLVGPNEPNYTCRSQFIDLIKTEIQKPSIDEIEKAFSIEKVTKEFFEKYKNLYHSLKENLDNLIKKDNNLKEEFENKQISTIDFSKKLLGQIVFLYFLQKKGWLGIKKGEGGKFEQWGKGSKRFIQELFYQAQQERENFFNDYLEPLFYHALATDRRADGDYYDKFNCKIPFLNGGLFEPLNGYNWGETDINLDNNVFEEIFKTFDEFNFTIKEDEPLEKEVAVDPEMLGKVFENLLDVEDRKSKGAFYTPREIVHYMCQQSLINYLETNINIPREDLEFFIQKGDLALEYLRRQEIVRGIKEEFVIPNSIKKNAKELERLLTEIKICDPAVGSGAFPVGMMNEIIKARTILLYILKKTKTDYELKRETIENSLYGVDVEPSAVEITKLRFWLSLIVDEEDMNNIKPLPNLENKIMCGNSLIEEFEGIKLYIDPTEIKELKDRQSTLDQTIERKVKKSEQKLKELRQKQKEFFDEENRVHKNRLREEIDKIEWEFIEETLREQGDGENMKKLEQYKKNKSKPFFLWKLYFSDVFHRENPGFDVVIGNPPYLRVQGIEREISDIYKKTFQSATGSYDLYVLFTENGLKILRKGAVLNYIMPHKWINASFGKGLRRIVKEKISKLISFAEYQVFNASNYTSLVWFKNAKQERMLYVKTERDLNTTNKLDNFLTSLKDKSFTLIKNKELSDNAWILTNGEIQIILKKLNRSSIKLKDVFEKIFQGIATGRDNVYFLKKYKSKGDLIIAYSKELDKKIKIEKDLVKPLLKGDDVHKYEKLKTDKIVIFPYKLITVDNQEKAILYSEREIKEKFPKGYNYLKECENILREREKGRFNIDGKWFQFARKQGIIGATKKKLIQPDISFGCNFSYDESGQYYATTTLYGYILKKSVKESYKFYLALLNSQLLWWYLKQTGTILANGYFRFKPDYLKLFPIPKIKNVKDTKPFIEIVDKILSITKGEDYLKNPEKQAMVKAYEKRIDKMVYDLYGLTPEEIKIVERFGK